jgi:transposase
LPRRGCGKEARDRLSRAGGLRGQRKTLYNRFNRWAGKGIWQRIFAAFSEAGGPPLETMLDSTH